MEVNTLSDPTRFAQAVRDLARDAHWTLRRSPSPAALRGLTRRIELLSSALGDRRGGPLGTWLDNLGREVRSAVGGARLLDRHSKNRRREQCLMSS
jgi:hypothetical protein